MLQRRLKVQTQLEHGSSDGARVTAGLLTPPRTLGTPYIDPISSSRRTKAGTKQNGQAEHFLVIKKARCKKKRSKTSRV